MSGRKKCFLMLTGFLLLLQFHSILARQWPHVLRSLFSFFLLVFTVSVQEECIKDVKYALSQAFRLFSCDFYLFHPISVLTPPSLAGWRPSVRFPCRHIDFSSRLSLSGCTCVKRHFAKGDYTLSVRGFFFITSFVLTGLPKDQGTLRRKKNIVVVFIRIGFYLFLLFSFSFLPSVVCVKPYRQVLFLWRTKGNSLHI